MHVVVGPPPNFESIKAVFPQAADKGVMFCYGDTIFSPSSAYIPPQLIAHEEIHSRQQAAMGPEAWWAEYLADVGFRYRQELIAHVVEYHDFLRYTKNRRMQRDYLAAVAKRLSGPLYGNVVSYSDALLEITGR